MRLRVISTGSKGNCYLLENDTECLVIDCGIPFMEIKKAIGFQITKIVGCLVTHCHKDHSLALVDFERFGIPTLAPYKDEKTKARFGNFEITAFENVHDVPCYGFYIKHPDMGTLVYATDTEYIKYRFSTANHFLVEANYKMELVDTSIPNYEHVLRGHMSIETCCKFIAASKSNNLRNVILCHLSNGNSNGEIFLEEISQVWNGNTYIAKKGLEVDLQTTPF